MFQTFICKKMENSTIKLMYGEILVFWLIKIIYEIKKIIITTDF